MPRGDAAATTAKILQAAEELFAEKGFNGASVSMIARKAGVNKALIYYYFQDKNAIMTSLWKNIVSEAEKYVSVSGIESGSLQDKIKSELTFLASKEKILAVLLMETLKSDNRDNHLFQIAEYLIDSDHCGMAEDLPDNPHERQRHLVQEFFTGFMPIFAFIVFRDKWCQYFDCNREQLLADFLASFHQSHLVTHEKG